VKLNNELRSFIVRPILHGFACSADWPHFAKFSLDINEQVFFVFAPP